MTRTEFYRLLGANIRRRRRVLDLTQRALAARLALPSTYAHKMICKYEHGLASIDLWRLRQLARALHCSPADLLPTFIPEPTR